MSHCYSFVRVLALSSVFPIVLFTSTPVFAQTPEQTLAGFKQAALMAEPGFQGFSAARGEKFFTSVHGNDWSCSTCHGKNPTVLGKHTKTNKVIQPLAPAFNIERFTDQAKVDKWFKRNCNDVLSRVCTAQEKGDVLAFLMGFKK
ncbi:MAG: DUF1924 domain-containing protein [Methylophilaceae bacterium]|nr:DUF1924 domain-containing protein [Methylophilaceae bacterium]